MKSWVVKYEFQKPSEDSCAEGAVDPVSDFRNLGEVRLSAWTKATAAEWVRGRRQDHKALKLIALNPWLNGVGWWKEGKVSPGSFQVENGMLGNIDKRRENGLRMYLHHQQKPSGEKSCLNSAKVENISQNWTVGFLVLTRQYLEAAFCQLLWCDRFCL